MATLIVRRNNDIVPAPKSSADVIAARTAARTAAADARRLDRKGRDEARAAAVARTRETIAARAAARNAQQLALVTARSQSRTAVINARKQPDATSGLDPTIRSIAGNILGGLSEPIGSPTTVINTSPGKASNFGPLLLLAGGAFLLYYFLK